jgi:ABC-type polysaccharide/polyol phosphate transport system ATPase subunit
MSPDVTISVESVSKKYCKSLKQSMVYGVSDIGKNMLGLSTRPGRLRPHEFWAVDSASFEVRRGQTLGLIGANGCGKTTMLKMLNGIFWPDRGKIMMRGRVGALIAVGSGFHPMLTGTENIFLNGAILGMGRTEMRKKFDSIVEFAGIGDFLDTPVKYYSSGMYVRLGFAVAIHCEPDILLVDEILAVGDVQFQAKCVHKMQGLERQGITKVFVSHDLNSVQLLCDQVLYMSHGKVQGYGATLDVIRQYKKDALVNESLSSHDTKMRSGTKEIVVHKIDFLDRKGHLKTLFKRGELFHLRVSFTAKKDISDPEFSVAFSTGSGVEVSKATTRDHGVSVGHVSGEGQIHYIIEALPFNVGRYFISVGCWDSTGHIPYDHQEKLYEILIEDGSIGGKIHERFGLVHVPATWKVA